MSSVGKVNAAFAAAVIFLLLSSVSAYIAISRLNVSEGWVRHTRDVQSALAQFSILTGRAGRLRTEFVESGDVALLQRQSEVVGQVRNLLTSIERATSDNAQEQADCKKLAELTEQRIEVMDESIQLKRAGKSTLEAQSASTRQIVAVAEETDHVMQRMYDAEEQLLTERQARVARSSAITTAVLVVSFIMALILFALHHRLLTEQAAAQARAEAAQRALSARLLSLQDEERRKFARELHDSVGQQLAALKMAMSILQPKLPGDTILEDCLKILDDSISETRTISHLLHPPLLDEAGLNSASRWFVEGFAKRSGIDVNLDIHDGEARLPPPVELVLFRVLQESLTNVHRHSGATRADVSLRLTRNRVLLRVKDYGRGMTDSVLQSIREERSSVGVGLAGMTERLREMGGRLEIQSSPAGTEILAGVPVDQRARYVPAAVSEVQP